MNVSDRDSFASSSCPSFQSVQTCTLSSSARSTLNKIHEAREQLKLQTLTPQQRQQETQALAMAERMCKPYISLGMLRILIAGRESGTFAPTYVNLANFSHSRLANQTISTFVLLTKHIVDPFVRGEVGHLHHIL